MKKPARPPALYVHLYTPARDGDEEAKVGPFERIIFCDSTIWGCPVADREGELKDASRIATLTFNGDYGYVWRTPGAVPVDYAGFVIHAEEKLR